MPTYEYKCKQCGTSQDRVFPFYLDRVNKIAFPLPDAISCTCGGESKKIISSQIQLCTNPIHLSDEWRPRLDATDQLKQDREDRKQYESHWEKATFNDDDGYDAV